MKIAVIDATGNLGGAVAREATARGHQVTALGSSNVDAADPASVKEAVTGHDAVVVAIAGGDRLVPRSAGALLEARDTPVADEKGESCISVGDCVAAVIDALENESFIHARFTVAY
jgi:putative NADH-flavin reductase